MVRLAALFLCLLTACGPVRAENSGPLPAPPSSFATPVDCGDDHVQVLRDGPPVALRISGLISHATQRVEVEMYEFGRNDIATALIAAHQRGVDVTVIDDPTVDVTAATAMRLRAAGVEVIDYPVRPMMIDHVKMLIIDSQTAVVGGINWGQRSFLNHDFDVQLTGPVVGNLERIFQRDLITAGIAADIPPSVPDPDIIVVSTLPMTEIRPLALTLIESARQTLTLDLYVLTDTAVVHAVENAFSRGVDVRVLLDPSERPNDAAAQELRDAGIDVRLYVSHGELLHAKAAIADGRRVLFGSANWSSGGFARNHEVDVEFPDCPPVATDFLQSFDAAWAVAERAASG